LLFLLKRVSHAVGHSNASFSCPRQAANAMTNPPQLTDWITAGATAITAVATGVAGLVAYLALRRDSTKELPVVEAILKPAGKSDALSLQAVIRNRIAETLVAESVRVTRPKGASLARMQSAGVSRRDATSGELMLGIEIPPAGSSIRGGPFDGTYSDSANVWLLLFPPQGWSAGVVEIQFRISSRALTIRDKRIVVRRSIGAGGDKDSTP